MPLLPASLRLLRRHDWYAPSATCAGTGLFAALTVMQFSQPTIVHGVLAVGGVVLTTTAAAIPLVRGNSERSANERQRRHLLARSLIEAAFAGAVRAMSNRPEQTGGFVYLPAGTNPDLLRPVFAHNKQGPVDEHLSWAKWVGCTGHAWGSQRQTGADLARTTAAELEEKWKLSPNAIKLTSELKAIVSTPIWSSEAPQRLIGVVSIDSTAPHEESNLLSQDSLEEALLLAATIALVLELAGLQTTDSVGQ